MDDSRPRSSPSLPHLWDSSLPGRKCRAFVSLSLCLSLSVCLCLSICLYLCLCLSICLSISPYLSLSLYLSLSVSLSVSLSLSLPICLSLSLPVSLYLSLCICLCLSHEMSRRSHQPPDAFGLLFTASIADFNKRRDDEHPSQSKAGIR